jgi:hypothetical protein
MSQDQLPLDVEKVVNNKETIVVPIPEKTIESKANLYQNLILIFATLLVIFFVIFQVVTNVIMPKKPDSTSNNQVKSVSISYSKSENFVLSSSSSSSTSTTSVISASTSAIAASSTPASQSSQSSFSVPTSPVQEKWQTYTNPSLPSLKIEYPDSWKLSSEPRASLYKGLISRDTTLSKNGFEFHVFTQPMVGTGCAVDPDSAKNLEFKKLGSNIYKTRYEDTQAKKTYIHYGLQSTAFVGCTIDIIKSSIDSSGFADYKATFPNDTTINFLINSTNIEEAAVDSKLLTELDEIMTRSSL